MAAKKTTTVKSLTFRTKSKKSRKGIHSKNSVSKSKKSKKYLKRYVGQGRP